MSELMREAPSTIKEPKIKKGYAEKGTLWKRMVKMKYYYLLLAPIIVYFLLFHYKPMYGIIIAFKDFRILDGIWNSPWAGLKHFKRVFSGYYFWRVFKNTFIISIYKLAFGFPAPIIFALLLNEIAHVRYKRFVQSLSYLPHFFSWVVLGGIVRTVLSPSFGVVNHILALLGFQRIYFLVEPQLFRGILVVTGIWQSIGWGSIVYLAAIAGVEQQQYEAAYIDGASRFQQALHITVPSIMPVVTIFAILSLSGLFTVGFDQVFNLYNPLVYETGDVISTYVYRKGIQGYDYSFGTAMGLWQSLIGVTLIVTVNMIVRRFSEYSLW